MGKIIIIADDITGACDSGVQFTEKGLKAVVFFDELEAEGVGADVFIYDTDSRAMNPDEAYKEVDRVAANLNKETYGMIFKKIDSTLRGNIGSEIDALMDRISFDIAVVAPAFPLLNRVTRNGIQYLNDEPIEETEIGCDPKTPVKESNIVNLLSNQTKREAVLFPKEWLYQDKLVILHKAKELMEDKKTLFVLDAENKQDLQQIANGFKELPFRVLWVGSAGLAEYLVSNSKNISDRVVEKNLVNEKLPVLIVSGSQSSIAKRQVDTLRQYPHVPVVSMFPDRLVEKESSELEIVRCQKELVHNLINGQDTVLNVEEVRKTALSDNRELPYLIVEALGKVASKAVKDIRLQGLILTGGDTAKSISRELGVTGLELIGEVERGMPLTRMIGGPGLLTVTKAGAFGSDRSLCQALTLLKGDGNL
ncbi:four-carbon acid sugar kinase family protein [Peribacillus butanolivorans]|uniref:four-carbon acid sugar kinase family protein n=1 Tax=Peribacillus butanolivorans TaxID=421767 RepID=UPI0037C7184E